MRLNREPDYWQKRVKEEVCLKQSPFDKWVGKLKILKKQKTDDIIENLRGT